MRHGGSYRFPQRMHRGVFTHPPSLFKNVADVGAGRGIVAYDLLVDVPYGAGKRSATSRKGFIFARLLDIRVLHRFMTYFD